MPKIVFMGTPEFAVPALHALIKSGFDIPLVISQPDRKKGRGQKVQLTPVKEAARQHQLEVYQPDSIRNPQAIERLAALAADFFVVIAYGKILPEAVLNLPRKACINVHASLLPRWRGAAPIQFSLLNGDRETGVCTMLMDKGMDTGDLLQIRKTEIGADENVGQLSARLAQMGAGLIVETLEQFDRITPSKQIHEKATYTRLLKKEDRMINWHQDADAIYCQFRAMTPTPGVITEFRGKRLAIKGMQLKQSGTGIEKTSPGEIVAIGEQSFDIACLSGAISVLRCQLESKKEVAAAEFVNGYNLKTGEIIGEKD